MTTTAMLAATTTKGRRGEKTSLTEAFLFCLTTLVFLDFIDSYLQRAV